MRILCALLLLPCLASAQGVDPRWPLMQPDSMVMVHASRIHSWAVNREGQNLITRNSDLIAVTLRAEADHLREALDLQRKAKESAKAEAELCEGLRMDLQTERDKYARQAQRRGRNTLLFTLAGVLVGIILTR